MGLFGFFVGFVLLFLLFVLFVVVFVGVFGGRVALFSCMLFAFILACFLVVLLGTNHLS